MKRLMMACLLAVSSHGWTADLNPECWEAYDHFTQAGYAGDMYNAGRAAASMYDLQCWPTLQSASESSGSEEAALPPITSCESLVPHVVNMLNRQNQGDSKVVLKVYNPKAMDNDTVNKVLLNVAMRGLDMYVDSPIAANPSVGERVLNCTGEARYEHGPMQLIQMYLDRDPDGQEFIGMASLMEM